MKLIGYYNYTVLATYIALVSAIVGIFYATFGLHHEAVIFLMISGFCDGFDGKIARMKKNRTNLEANFGVQIDSLTDLISFGVLPIFIGFSIGMHSPGHLIVFAIYVLAALVRLAYFNVLAESEMNVDSKGRKCYSGLPVTSVSLTIPILYILGQFFRDRFDTVYMCFLLLTMLAFVVDFKLVKPGNKQMAVMVLIGAIEFALIINGYHF